MNKTNKEIVDYLIEGNKHCVNLISAQEAYIKFLEEEVTKYALTSKYQISAKDFNHGQQLRDQIEEMSEFLEK